MRILKTKIRGIIFLLVVVFKSTMVLGQQETCDSLSAQRMEEIQKILMHDRISAQRWWYGWIWSYNAATLGQGIVYFSTGNTATKQDMALGSATTILGALSLLVTPIVPPKASGQISHDKDITLNAQKNDLVFYEESLEEIARREKLGRSWKSHAICGAANLGSGLITWIGFNRTMKDGLVNFVLNTVITEAQIWSQPTGAIKDLENYKMKYDYGTEHADSKTRVDWYMHVYPGRVSIGLVF